MAAGWVKFGQIYSRSKFCLPRPALIAISLQKNEINASKINMLVRSKSFSSNLPKTFHFIPLLPYSRKATRFAYKDEEEENEKAERRRLKREDLKDGRRIYLYKNRGQHILTNPRVLDAIVRKARIRPTDTVLEIGPGTGNLTLKLLEAADKVVAVEIDTRMIEILNRRVSECGLGDRLTVICKDALKIQFPKFDLCVANIPYGISSPLVAKLLFGSCTFRSATLLLQKEFARRLVANPGDSEFNRLAVNVKLVATVEFLMDVSKKDFVPCPKVDSSLIRIQPKSHIPDVDLDEWRAFTRTCFGKKNKTLGAIFKQKRKVLELLRLSDIECGQRDNDNNGHNDNENDDSDEDEGGYDDDGEVKVEGDGEVKVMSLFKEKVLSVLRAGGYEEKRPSKLSVEELLCLLSLFNQAGIRFHPS